MGMVSDTESAMLRKVIVRALLITVPALLVPLFFTGRAIHGKPGPRFALKAEIDSEPHAPAQSQPNEMGRRASTLKASEQNRRLAEEEADKVLLRHNISIAPFANCYSRRAGRVVKLESTANFSRELLRHFISIAPWPLSSVNQSDLSTEAKRPLFSKSLTFSYH